VSRQPRGPDDGWTSEVASCVALAGFLFLVLIGFTLLAMGPLSSLDDYFNLVPPPPAWVPFLHVMDRIGQRAVCLPVLAVATLVCCRRHRSWRPAWVVAASVFLLNLVVVILKVGLGRAEPQTADPSFFSGGMAYPSGHTSNIVLVYGLAAYLLGRYGGVGRGIRVLMWGAVAMLSVTMVFTSLTLNWHWFADLIAGLLVGATVLELTAAADTAAPRHLLSRSPLREVRQLRDRLRPPTLREWAAWNTTCTCPALSSPSDPCCHTMPRPSPVSGTPTPTPGTPRRRP
jgi:membrane-associated phospholipid phosphatase